MIELLSTLTVTQVIVFIILILLALKEALSLYDFFKNRLDKKYDDDDKDKKQIEDIFEELKALKQEIKTQEKNYEKLNNNIIKLKSDWEQKEVKRENTLELLVNSDKDAIKSFIVKEHHHFIEEGWIDDFSLDTIERRYTHYKEEGGNSYIHDLIKDLRELPNMPPRE